MIEFTISKHFTNTKKYLKALLEIQSFKDIFTNSEYQEYIDVIEEGNENGKIFPNVIIEKIKKNIDKI